MQTGAPVTISTLPRTPYAPSSLISYGKTDETVTFGSTSVPLVSVREPFGYNRLPSISSVVPFAMRDGEASGADEEDVALARSEREETEETDESEAAALGKRELGIGAVADAEAEAAEREGLSLIDEGTVVVCS